MDLSKEEFAKKIITEYVHENNVSVPVQIHFVDNINDSWILYTHNKNVIKQFLREDFSENNGLMLPFNGIGYHILIRNDYPDYECTIIHECTHVIDYDNFRVLFNKGKNDIELHRFYWCMALYSEFHARAMGHFHYINNIKIDCDKEKLKIKEVNDIYLDIINIENQIRTTKNGYIIQKLNYKLMQDLGRYYSYEISELVPEYFSENIIKLYSCLIRLKNNWDDCTFEATKSAIEQLNN